MISYFNLLFISLYIENKSLSYEEGYIVTQEQPADELLGKGLRLAQHPPQIIPESPVDE